VDVHTQARFIPNPDDPGPKKKSPSFLKKRSKKLLIEGAKIAPDHARPTFKSFLVLFFKKEHACFPDYGSH
jgi:hypothetical protein